MARSSHEIVSFIYGYLKEFENINDRTLTSNVGLQKWSPSPKRVTKINFDAEFAKELKFGSGVVVKNESGTVLGSQVVILKDIASTFEEDALACREAVRLGLALKKITVIIEGDLTTRKLGMLKSAFSRLRNCEQVL